MKNGWYEDNGDLEHHVNHKSHNYKSPALIWKDGSKFWIQNDQYHRLDGPAMEYSDGHKYWFYQGEIINYNSQQEFDRYLKLKLLW